jgi:CHAD domain-containing protein
MKMINTRKFDGSASDLLEQVKKLQQIIGDITDLCMEEIERKGAYDAPQIALDIMELIE